MNGLRHLSSFTKSKAIPTKEEFSSIKSRLLSSEWHLEDEFLSPSPARQMYVTLQSLLSNSQKPFMEQFNIKSSSNSENKVLSEIFRKGSPLPPGYTLPYCNPLSYEYELGTDGYDNFHAPTLNNVEFFKRRMWVNGSFTFNNDNPLTFGSPVHFKETINTIRHLKRSKMIFADYHREFSNSSGLSVKESRGLCYIEDVYQPNSDEASICKDTPQETTVVTPSILTNFRMSAVTFNSHQIHYNPDYAKSMESYNDTVIEAPLLLSLALQFWCNKNPKKQMKRFKYKIIMPSYVNEPLSINYRQADNLVKLWISNKNSATCFDSTIEF